MSVPNAAVVPTASPIPLWRSVAVLALAGLTILICFQATPPPAKSEAGIRLELPASLGLFQGKPQEVSEAEKVILPQDTGFAKMLYTDDDGDRIGCQIVLAGGEKRSIHRPEVCLRGQGWDLQGGEVIPVSLANGKTLKVMKLSLRRTISGADGEARGLTMIYLYWFVGKDITTPNHFVRILKSNLDMLLYNTNHRWAYVVVNAPVLEGLAPNGKDEAQTLEVLKAFIADLVPQITAEPSAG